MVAGGIQPRHAQRFGDLLHRRQQCRHIVDQIAQGHAQPRQVAALQRLHDVAPEVVHVVIELHLRIAEYQHLRGFAGQAARRAPIGDAAGHTGAVGMGQRQRCLHADRHAGRRVGGRLRGIGKQQRKQQDEEKTLVHPRIMRGEPGLH